MADIGSVLGLVGLGKKKPRPILVVDDDASIAGMSRDVLESVGYAVITASDGVEGLKLAESERPQLILLDIRMPKLDGLQTLELLKKKPGVSDIPVLMVSSEQMGADVEQAFNLGAAGYVIKPFEIGRLLEKVQKLAPLSGS